MHLAPLTAACIMRHHAMGEETNYLSKEKFDELTGELEHLKTVRRREIAEQLEYARSLGDLSENAEYEEARNLQAATEDRIRTIEEQHPHIDFDWPAILALSEVMTPEDEAPARPPAGQPRKKRRDRRDD